MKRAFFAMFLTIQMTPYTATKPKLLRSVKIDSGKCTGISPQQCKVIESLSREWLNAAPLSAENDACAGITDLDCYTVTLKKSDSIRQLTFKTPLKGKRLCKVRTDGALDCEDQKLQPAQKILFELQSREGLQSSN